MIAKFFMYSVCGTVDENLEKYYGNGDPHGILLSHNGRSFTEQQGLWEGEDATPLPSNLLF